jgi:hypothetical protein
MRGVVVVVVVVAGGCHGKSRLAVVVTETTAAS